MDPISLTFIWRVFEKINRAFSLGAVCASSRDISQLNTDDISEFQKAIVNYSFMASELCRKFREADDTAKEKLYQDLNTGLRAGQKVLCGQIAGAIQNYFKFTHKSPEAPRIGIHILNDENQVVDIVLLAKVDKQPSEAKVVEDYSVLEKIVFTGEPYLDNNIPKTINSDPDYKHLGLNTDKILRDYRRPVLDSRLVSRFRKNVLYRNALDKKWNEMASTKVQGGGSLYKSHIVVPISFRKHAEQNKLSQEMIRTLELPDEGRSILGFIFVDHPASYYFDESYGHNCANIDINHLLIWADLISLVFIVQLTYTKGSVSIKNYLKQKMES